MAGLTVQAQKWEAYTEDHCKQLGLQAEQQEEIEALSYVFEGLQVRMDQEGMIEIRLMDLELEKHRAKVTIVLGLPVGYPDEVPKVSLHSATIPKTVLIGVSEDVLAHFVQGEPAGHALIMEAESSLMSMEPAHLSSHFVACPKCNVKDLKADRSKQPQPSGPDYATCLTCGSYNVVPLVTAKPNRDEEPCALCFCEEAVMVELACGEVACMECFQRLATVDVGAKKLKLDPKTDHWTIACPTHPTAFVSDIALMKMAPPRTFNQYARFSFEKGLDKVKAITCPLSACTNFPFIPGSRHNFQHCPYCYRWFCAVCLTATNECMCKALKSHSEPHLPVNALRDLTPKGFSGGPAIPIRVKYHGGDIDIEISKQDTAATLLMLCSVKAFQQTYYMYNSDDPWGSEVYEVPLKHMVAIWCGKVLDPSDVLVSLYPGAQVYLVLHYPATRRMLEGLDDEADLWQFRRGSSTPLQPGKERKGDFVGKKCPFCTKPVLHYYKHGCHHIGFAGEGCCESHWCYVCLGPHPCRKCTTFCDNARQCKCPLCPDCKPGWPCPTCMGCPQCRPTSDNNSPEVFDMFD
eukprot:TRINITY_DN7915_c2_g3_i1.p1 TRINITY_DN7915_c2_g3~~TRINITY_DN7915_c2_g3_i1.p1  ORF type:complete len:576 (+),score=67.65 TRINITY_DN7915_c2_g3_i1:68-1795(+)